MYLKKYALCSNSFSLCFQGGLLRPSCFLFTIGLKFEYRACEVRENRVCSEENKIFQRRSVHECARCSQNSPLRSLCRHPAHLICFFLINFSDVFAFLRQVINVLFPFILAFVFAYLLNRPMRFFEKLFLKAKLSKKLSRILAVTLVYLIVLGILSLLIIFILPQFIESVATVIDRFPSYKGGIEDTLNSVLSHWNVSAAKISDMAGSLSELGSKVLESMGLISVSLLSVMQNVTNTAINFCLALLLSVYVLYGKEMFIRQSKKVLYWILPESKGDLTLLILHNANMMFSMFINSKLLTSFLVGFVVFLICTIFGVPYALLLCLIMGIANLIPFFGPIVGTVICLLLLLVFSPTHFLLFLIAAIIIQAIEGNILVPWLCGNKMGLPGFWVMFGILVGGGFFGVIGMFLGVPFTAVLYSLFSFVVEIGLENKRVSPDKMDA